MRTLLLGAVTAAVLVVGTASAGNYTPPPGDYAASWVTNSVLLVGGSNIVDLTTGKERPFTVPGVKVAGPVLAASVMPLIAFVANGNLAVAAPDGTQLRVLASGGAPVAWVRDPPRIVFTETSGRLASIQADGSGFAEYPAKVRGTPSPDGSRFVYVADTPAQIPWVTIVDADGTATQRIDTGAGPVWSPDGTRIAYWSGGVGGLGVAASRHARRWFDIPGYVTNGSIVWAPDGRTVFGEGKAGLVGINLATGARHALAGIPLISNPVFSPDGTRLAFAAGGECRDRDGIYVARADGSHRRRVSNSCTVLGTDGPDVLTGDFSQVVVGLGGNDTLYAGDGYYFFDGDTLYGGPGNDKLYGGDGIDVLYGGPGNDLLDGGAYHDVLIGGPGHDHIDGGTGNDTIGARDGERDWIACGTSGKYSGVREHDIVYADKIDVVAKDCEVVHRR